MEKDSFFTPRNYTLVNRVVIVAFSTSKISEKQDERILLREKHNEKIKTHNEYLSHFLLLRNGTMILYGQDDGKWRVDKCSFVNGLDHRLK